jgi:FKBP-type peptidyl-prolyl cis-trans isomerase
MKNMKRMIPAIGILMAFTLTSSLPMAQEADKASQKKPETLAEKVSYMVGIQMGNSVKKVPTKVNMDIFMRGFNDALEGRKPLFTEEESKQIQKEFMDQVKQDRGEQGKKNLEAGKAFLEENKKKEGVVTIESGLQYLVLRDGDGPMPTEADDVTIHFRGMTIDGKEFNKSYKGETPADTDKPLTFPLRRLEDGRGAAIEGWLQAMPLMKVGSKFRLFIPGELAYGERGLPNVSPNATVIFDVELIKAEKSALTDTEDEAAQPGDQPTADGQTTKSLDKADGQTTKSDEKKADEEAK